MRVGRRYKFRATHHVEGLSEPWCSPHAHDYTVEVVYDSQPNIGLAINHEALDARWGRFKPQVDGADLNTVWPRTTVEALADEFQKFFHADEVTVWEDDNRWATACKGG